MQKLDELIEAVRGACNHGEVAVEENSTPTSVRIPADDLREVCLLLYHHPKMYFDMLSCITAIDNGPEADTVEVVYNLYSIPFHLALALKVVLPREEPEIDTVQDIWKTANWHEREAWDLVGVKFKGHPDLRRILLPADWEGHPLRKDYQKQEYYRGIQLD